VSGVSTGMRMQVAKVNKPRKSSTKKVGAVAEVA